MRLTCSCRWDRMVGRWTTEAFALALGRSRVMGAGHVRYRGQGPLSMGRRSGSSGSTGRWKGCRPDSGGGRVPVDPVRRRLGRTTRTAPSGRCRTEPFSLVQEKGLEPLRPHGHQLLKLTRLPIPPLLRDGESVASGRHAWGVLGIARLLALPASRRGQITQPRMGAQGRLGLA